jgi:hypothetical protein
MSARVYVDAVEGNDVWLVWRVTLPNGANLVRVLLVGEGESGTAMTVSLIHESSLGNSKEVIQLYSGLADATENAAFNVHTALQTTLWGGLDDIGYTVEARIAASGTDYILEGGNTYAVEVNLFTIDWGTVTVAAQIQVDYLHSV